ncbi:MAG: hypothetical protein KJZ83_03405 [Burkholderiaceae bacterium]|nr:hypothetical protein [Burkholderiaceae bacterium]
MLNRGVLIVRPAQPYVEWALSLDESGIAPDAEEEQTVYLIPGFDDDHGAARVLKAVFSEVFERELDGWHTDESRWPKNRTLATFKRWFRIEMHSVVEDLCADELYDDVA